MALDIHGWTQSGVCAPVGHTNLARLVPPLYKQQELWWGGSPRAARAPAAGEMVWRHFCLGQEGKE